jgi:hypothetical protein
MIASAAKATTMNVTRLLRRGGDDEGTDNLHENR